MKPVLLNSADKIKDDGNGGANRDVSLDGTEPYSSNMWKVSRIRIGLTLCELAALSCLLTSKWAPAI